MRWILLVAGLGLAGCTTSSNDGPLNYDAELRAYIDCNHRASVAVSTQSGEVLALAVAARGLCGNEGQRLRNRVSEGRSVVLTDRIMRIFETGAIEANTTTIVTSRAAQSRPAPRREAPAAPIVRRPPEVRV
jgi:hypothetical protein